MEYLLIDLNQYADDELEAIQMKILMAMLLLFKHKGDKDYVLKNFPKFFIFVEERPDGMITNIYLKIFVLYIYQTFNFEKEDLQKAMPTLPTPVKNEFMTMQDSLLTEGYQKGKLEGKLEGEIKTKIKVFIDLLLNFSDASDDLLVTITKFPKGIIIALKKAFKGKKKTELLKIGRKLFEPIPNISTEQWKELDAFILDLWKQYKKGLRRKS